MARHDSKEKKVGRGCTTPRSQGGRVVSERHVVRVLRTIVQVPLLGNLGDQEIEEHAGDDSLVQRVLHQVQCLVVDAVDLLQALQVVLLGGRVGDGPETQVVHVAQVSEGVLEGSADALCSGSAVRVLEGGLADVVDVRDRLPQVLPRRLQVRKLVHFSKVN